MSEVYNCLEVVGVEAVVGGACCRCPLKALHSRYSSVGREVVIC